MSLRLQINLIIIVMMTLFIGTLVYQQVQDTRSSVREEIEGTPRKPPSDQRYVRITVEELERFRKTESLLQIGQAIRHVFRHSVDGNRNCAFCQRHPDDQIHKR